MADLGADRGILMAESGYQRGALEAAQLTNVQLTSLAELTVTASKALVMAQLPIIQERIDVCRDRYWKLDKYTRIEHGLRPDTISFGYSGTAVIKAVEVAINAAMRGQLPAAIRDSEAQMYIQSADSEMLSVNTLSELVTRIESLTADLERRLDAVYAEVNQKQI